MKQSTLRFCSGVTTVVIVIIGSRMIWRNHQVLEQIASTRNATEAGLRLGGQVSSRLDRTQANAPNLTIHDIVTVCAELGSSGYGSMRSNQVCAARAMELRNRLMKQEPGLLKKLLAEIRASQEVNVGMKDLLIGSGIVALAKDRPDAALKEFVESIDLFDPNNTMGMALSAALGAKARLNPDEAIAWFQKFAGTHSGAVVDAAKSSLIRGVAVTSPAKAFDLLADLGAHDAASTAATIVTCAESPESLSSALTAMRGYLSKIDSSTDQQMVKESTLSAMASNLVEMGYQQALPWLEAAAFTPDELKTVIGQWSYRNLENDMGNWIEWLSTKEQSAECDGRIRQWVEDWTKNDYRAAGDWLCSSSTRAQSISINAYAKAVGAAQPEYAEHWAERLGDEDSRNAAIGIIYQELKQTNSDSAAAFAKRNGIDSH
jgi:hypothetical protein